MGRKKGDGREKAEGEMGGNWGGMGGVLGEKRGNGRFRADFGFEGLLKTKELSKSMLLFPFYKRMGERREKLWMGGFWGRA